MCFLFNFSLKPKVRTELQEEALLLSQNSLFGTQEIKKKNNESKLRDMQHLKAQLLLFVTSRNRWPLPAGTRAGWGAVQRLQQISPQDENHSYQSGSSDASPSPFDPRGS